MAKEKKISALSFAPAVLHDLGKTAALTQSVVSTLPLDLLAVSLGILPPVPILRCVKGLVSTGEAPGDVQKAGACV